MIIRKPLRPLIDVLLTRVRGGDPAQIEYENIQDRRRAAEAQVQHATQRRLQYVVFAFAAVMMILAGKMTMLAMQGSDTPNRQSRATDMLASRADILDRNGRIMAMNYDVDSLYVNPQIIVDADAAVTGLAQIFPDIDSDWLAKILASDRKFAWLKGSISPEHKQAVHDLGEPGLIFGKRERRLYPNRAVAAHVLGGFKYENEAAASADILGVAGVEKAFDAYLYGPNSTGQPLRLSIDLTVQTKLEDVLASNMQLMGAKGAAAVMMDVHTGEIVALASLPDFDPNHRPRPLTQGKAEDSPLFNRAVQGVYELGSALKPFALAQGLDMGLIEPDTKIDIRGPIEWGPHKIRDFHNYGSVLTAEKVLVKSSNIGTARIAQNIGVQAQQEFLGALGLLKATSVELIEAPTGRPQYAKNWSELSTMTISYGHGLSISPLHLAAAYATLANGGHVVKPTLLAGGNGGLGPRVISQQTSEQMRDMLRKVVTQGTASMAQIDGYEIGGKTGTADKPNPRGEYDDDRVISTFASIFPAYNPQYSLVVMLDEPEDTSGAETRRTAGWTAVPASSVIISRTAPLLGVMPALEPNSAGGVTQVSMQ